MTLHRAMLTRLFGLKRTAISFTLGIASLSNSILFDCTSGLNQLDPVMFPPGRASLTTAPEATASPMFAITIGIVVGSPC